MYHSGYKYTTHNLCQTECFVILAKYMSLYKEQLTKPIPATDETHVEGRNHGLACAYWHTQPRSR